MQNFDLTGLHCAACSSRVEKVVSELPNVNSCSVNLLTNSMQVDGTATPDEIITAVQKAGYGATIHQDTASKANSANFESKDKEIYKLKLRLIWSTIFLIILMYISMGHMMWNLPIPPFLAKNHVSLALTQLLLTTIVMVINQNFFISGLKSLIHKSPNMDTLVSLGAGTAFIYSTASLFGMINAQAHTDQETISFYMNELYFESAAMILTLITVGKMLEIFSKNKTTNALQKLMNLKPKTATIIQNHTEKIIPVENVIPGDIFIVRPGESIPVDGIIVAGNSAIDESTLSGESIPVDKTTNDTVSAATINQSGFLRCKATKVGEDTVISQIIKIVKDTSVTKAPISKIADKVSGIFVPVVIAISVITTILWIIIKNDIGFALSRGISVLVISCPCALGLATPVAIMVSSGVGANLGILYKNATSLEETGKIKTIALDKTGTITVGNPTVTDIIPLNNTDKNTLLQLAYSIEKKSEHPLAKAIVKKCDDLKIKQCTVENFKVSPGNGLSATIDNNVLVAGNYDFISKSTHIPEEVQLKAKNLSSDGKTVIFFSNNDVLCGIIAVADVIRPDSPRAILKLREIGIKVIVITGDNEQTANTIGHQVGVDKIIAKVLPQEKANVISKLQMDGKVAMVGDGINDAPALTKADIGIAIGTGTDISIDSADIVLMKSQLSDIYTAVRLSKATLKNIKQNLFWAFFYNALGIPLAAGVFSNFLSWQLSPMFAAAAMSLSSFCVVTNALRLNWFKS